MKEDLHGLLVNLKVHFSEKTNRLSVCCPFHDDRNPSAAVYLDTKLFHCFTCEITYPMVRFVMKVRNCGKERAEAFLEKFGFEAKIEDPRNRLRADVERQKAEDLLSTILGRLPMKVHANLGSLLDVVFLQYDNGQMDDVRLDLFLQRWRRRVLIAKEAYGWNGGY